MGMDEINLKLWKRCIGTLPEGFFIKVSGSQLSLYYRGSGHKKLTEPGGSKPTGDCACICMHDIRDVDLRKKVCAFIRKHVVTAQKTLSG